MGESVQPIGEPDRNFCCDRTPFADRSGQWVNLDRLLQPVFDRELCLFRTEQLGNSLEERRQLSLGQSREIGTDMIGIGRHGMSGRIHSHYLSWPEVKGRQSECRY